jgi:hypothetical protein
VQAQNNNDTQGDTGGPTNATLQRADENACTHMQVHGVMTHKENSAQLDQISLEAKWRSGAPPGLERFLNTSLHESRGQG